MDVGKKQCPVCSSKRTVLNDEKLRIYSCKGCSHTFTSISKKEEETYGQSYFDEDHKNWFTYINKDFYDFVYSALTERLGNKKARLLDVGCGRGSFLKHVLGKKDSTELCGIDLVDNRHDGIRFIKGDFLAQKFGKRFNLVCNFAVAEHVNDPILFAKKLNGALEPNGLLALMTVNNNSLVYRIARLFKKLGVRIAFNRLYSWHHLQHYTGQSLKKTIEENGFKIVLRKNHNWPIAGMDVPHGNFVMQNAYRLSLGLLFLASSALKSGLYQTIICEKVSEA